MAGKDRSLSSGVLVFIGAAAGLAVILSLIGALISWERFRTLELPSQAASATLSQSTLLVVGTRALAVPLLLGLVTVAVAAGFRRLGFRLWSRRWILPVIFLCVAALIALAAVFGPLYLVLYIAVAAILVFAALMLPSTRTDVVSYAIFFMMVGAGTVVAGWQILRPPNNLERAVLNFSNGHQPIEGFWIAETSTTVYVAPQVKGKDGPCQVAGEVLAFPRDDVASISFDSAVSVWPANHEPPPAPCPEPARPPIE